MEENEIIKLLPKKKKGILRIIFSRAALIGILLLLEAVVLFSVFIWFGEYFKYFAFVQILFYVLMIIYLFNSQMDGTVKLTWLYMIMLAPIPATIMLWFSRRDTLHRTVKWRVEQLTKESKDILKQDDTVIKNEELSLAGVDDLCVYLNRSGHFPIYNNTDVAYFPLGERKYEALIEELKKAEKFIYMEYFIIDEGYMWGSILKILADKASEGVDVRVMYDGMCEVSLLTHDYPKRMAKLGIKCKPFTPITPFISTQYNYRDHRKILVIDGKVAFNGGINLADEYINKVDRFGHWKDAAIMLKGKAVQSFTLMFLQMWNITERQLDWDKAHTVGDNIMADGYVMPYCDSPLDEDKVGENVYIDILYRAKSYVHIMTPYLILDNELENAIKYAAQRGVDVKIILPGVPDKKYAFALAKTHYRSLLKAGVKIYEYTPGFVHAKVFVCDDERAVVGTINLDYRSLYHHFECATYMYKAPCIKNIEDDFNETAKKCLEVTKDTMRKDKRFYKIVGGLLKPFAPFM